MISYCVKCSKEMLPGKELENSLSGIPDFIGDDFVCTVSRTGPVQWVKVFKCPECGYTITRGTESE